VSWPATPDLPVPQPGHLEPHRGGIVDLSSNRALWSEFQRKISERMADLNQKLVNHNFFVDVAYFRRWDGRAIEDRVTVAEGSFHRWWPKGAL